MTRFAAKANQKAASPAMRGTSAAVAQHVNLMVLRRQSHSLRLKLSRARTAIPVPRGTGPQLWKTVKCIWSCLPIDRQRFSHWERPCHLGGRHDRYGARPSASISEQAPWRLGTRLKKPDPRVRFLSHRRGNVIGVRLETDIGGGSTALDLRAGDEDRTRDVQLDGMKALQHFLCHP